MIFGSHRLRPATLLAPAGVALVLHAFVRLPLVWVERDSPTFTHPWQQAFTGVATDMVVSFGIGTVAAFVALLARPLQSWPAALFRAPFVAAFGLLAAGLAANVTKVGWYGEPLTHDDLAAWRELPTASDAVRAWLLDAGHLAAFVPCALLWFVFVSAFAKTLKDGCEAAIGVRAWKLWGVVIVAGGITWGFQWIAEQGALEPHEAAENHPVPYVWMRVEHDREHRVTRPEAGIAALEGHLTALGATPLDDDGYPTRNRRTPPAQPALGPRTNVVMLVLEGGGLQPLLEKPAIAPFLAKLQGNSVVLDQHFTTMFRTDGAEFSLLCGLYDPAEFIVARDYPRQPLRCLPRILSERGFSTHFVTGADIFADRTREFLRTEGMDELVSAADFADDVDRASRGVHDGPVLDRLLDVLDSAKSPSFTMVRTTSLQPPFEVPERFLEGAPDAAELEGWDRSWRYVDAQLSRFFEKARAKPWFQDTLFVIVGNHAPRGWAAGDPREGTDFEAQRARYRTVAMLVHPKLAPRRISADSSHIDLAPTILALLGVDAVTDFEGRDLFSNAKPPDFVASHDRSRGFFYTLHDREKALVRGVLTNRCDVLEAGKSGVRRPCRDDEWFEVRTFEQTFGDPLRWEIVEAHQRQSSFATAR